MSQAKRLLAAFAGSTNAHGTTTVGRIGRNGKAEAKSMIVREPLTEDLVQKHIDGERGVGSIPINEENQCRFGALDIDIYDLNHEELNGKLRKLGLPLLHCRSKSGGAHLYLFLDQFESAAVVREYLTEFSIILGYSGCEVFPKQDRIISERGDVGNFINMPYFNAELPQRYCYNDKVEALELDEFLDAVDANAVSLNALEAFKVSKPRKHFSDGPPCLQHIFADGPIGEPRNKVGFHACKYFKMKSPDDWQQEFENFNRTLFNPPLASSEVITLVNQHEKKEYGYTCKEEPMRSFCDPVVCATQKHGIGSEEAPDAAKLGGLTIQLSEPRLYFMDVNGERIVLRSDELQNQTLWQRACMEQCNIMPPITKPQKWQQTVNALMQQATYLEVPEEGTTRGEFKDLLGAYCTGRIRALEPQEIEMGKPWTEDGVTRFTLVGLSDFLHNRRFTKLNRAQLIQLIRDFGGDDETFSLYRDDGKRKQIRVWYVPAMEADEPTLTVKEIQDDIPF